MNAYRLICDGHQWILFRVDFVPMTDHQDDGTDSSAYPTIILRQFSFSIVGDKERDK